VGVVALVNNSIDDGAKAFHTGGRVLTAVARAARAFVTD
jgi:hypothetical protein